MCKLKILVYNEVCYFHIFLSVLLEVETLSILKNLFISGIFTIFIK